MTAPKMHDPSSLTLWLFSRGMHGKPMQWIILWHFEEYETLLLLSFLFSTHRLSLKDKSELPSIYSQQSKWILSITFFLHLFGIQYMRGKV